VFGLPATRAFPNPGRVPTTLCYKGTVLDWPAGTASPDGFADIARAWSDFVSRLVAPLHAAWRKGQRREVMALWQRYIDRFKDMSFAAAVREGIPAWTDQDLQRFGALGLGSGGFGPLFPCGFLELLRILVNMWEEDQQFLPCGIGAVMDAFYTRPVVQPSGRTVALQDLGAVRFGTRVQGLTRGRDGHPVVQYTDPAGTVHARAFAAVIVATTTRAMQTMGLASVPSDARPPLLDAPVRAAVRDLPLLHSSKLFIRTATKFWKEPRNRDLPQNIQMDEAPRGVYALDYPQTTNGIILMSYTWGEDSRCLQALAPRERFVLFRRAIARVSPRFAAALEPVGGEILCIDWQTTEPACGAFKLQGPGQEAQAHAAYYQFLSVLDPARDRGVYLAGDSVSWAGGWIEGALETGINAACAAARRIGAHLAPGSPLSMDPHLYDYGTSPAAAGAAAA
jgi:tryptophan 2-monooxygenase